MGWSEERESSAACYLAFNHDGACVETDRFRASVLAKRLSALVSNRSLLAAAFDGPFRRDLDEIAVYRACERVLTIGLAPHIGKPGQSSSPNGRELNRAANACVRAALAMACVAEANHLAAIHPFAVVEAFPTSFLGVMLDAGCCGAGKIRSDSYFERLTADPRGDRLAGLAKSLLGGRPLRSQLRDFRNHDDRAAIVCAITALCVAARRYTAVGDENGYIILPPPVADGECGLQPWAMAIICSNLAKTPRARLIVEA
jgi:hypothetical protein